MTDQTETAAAVEAESVGEKPDHGRTPDTLPEALKEALSGSDMGSDTRSGSLQGGAASGSDIDPDQATINDTLANAGKASADPQSPAYADPDPVNNTGEDLNGPGGDPAEGKQGDADAATG